jgi:hypothetical protein
VPRPDWPEAPWLERWLARHARFAPIEAAALAAGRLAPAIATLAAQPARVPARGDGAAAIATRSHAGSARDRTRATRGPRVRRVRGRGGPSRRGTGGRTRG